MTGTRKAIGLFLLVLAVAVVFGFAYRDTTIPT